MIRINLAKKKSISAQDQMTEFREKTKTIIGVLERFKLVGKSSEDNSDTKGPIIRLVAAIMICFLAEGYVADFQQAELDKLNSVLTKYQKEAKEAKAEVDKIKNFEPLKKQLEDNEQVLTAKLDVVNELMQSRSHSIKILYALSNSLPADVWVKAFKRRANEITITGGALEFNYVSDFMKKLSENTYFGNVQPKFQKNERTSGGVQFVSFELSVRSNQKRGR